MHLKLMVIELELYLSQDCQTWLLLRPTRRSYTRAVLRTPFFYNLQVRILFLICPCSYPTLQDSNLGTEVVVHHGVSLDRRTSGPDSKLSGRSETPGSARPSFSEVKPTSCSRRPFQASSVCSEAFFTESFSFKISRVLILSQLWSMLESVWCWNRRPS